MEGLRPLGVGELIDASIRIYRSRWKTLMAAVAIPILPVLVFSSLVNWSSRPDTSIDPSTGQMRATGGQIGIFLVASLVSVVASVIGTSIATAACFRSISGAYVGDDADWRESLRFGFRRLGSVVGVSLLHGLALVAGILVFCLGVLWPLAVFSVAVPVLLMEGLSAPAAMGRSRRLVHGMGWRVLGVVLLGVLMALIFQSVLSAPLAILILNHHNGAGRDLLQFGTSLISSVLVTPFTAALHMALYVDLRVRKEGFDLMLWTERLGTAAPVEGFPSQPGVPVWAEPQGYPAPGQPSPGYSGPGYSTLPPPPPPPSPPPPSSGSPSPWAPHPPGPGGPSASG